MVFMPAANQFVDFSSHWLGASGVDKIFEVDSLASKGLWNQSKVFCEAIYQQLLSRILGVRLQAVVGVQGDPQGKAKGHLHEVLHIVPHTL